MSNATQHTPHAYAYDQEYEDGLLKVALTHRKAMYKAHTELFNDINNMAPGTHDYVLGEVRTRAHRTKALREAELMLVLGAMDRLTVARYEVLSE